MPSNILILLLILLCHLQLAAQRDSTLQLVSEKMIEGNYVDFTTDNLGNIYLVNGSNQVKKLNAKGDSVGVYNDVKRYGGIFSVDATNPLKVLIYYKDFATVVVLDRLLTVRNTINLRNQNIFQVQAITSSYDNKIWLYDEQESRIKKIDDNGEVLFQSTDLRQVFKKVPVPQSMFDRDGELYLYDKNNGLFIFDYYGALKSNTPLPGITDLQVIDKNTVTGRDSTRIILYKPKLFQQFSFVTVPEVNNVVRLRFTGSKIYALNLQGTLEIFQAN